MKIKQAVYKTKGTKGRVSKQARQFTKSKKNIILRVIPSLLKLLTVNMK